jgi:DNA-binding NarL/FixJ family response regulator
MTETSADVRILIADSQSLFREAVRAVLDGEEGLEVVGAARSGDEALAEARRSEPDVALVDADLSLQDGIGTTRQIREQVPGCRVLVLSGGSDEEILERAIEAGAHGFLQKESPLAELITAMRAIHRGETVVPPPLLGPLLHRLISRRREQEEAQQRLSRLTKRERQVLGLLANGADNESIAQELVISAETARTHIQNILGKLGVHSRLEAAAFVIQNEMAQELLEEPPQVIRLRG